jgi:hypothetical protein
MRRTASVIICVLALSGIVGWTTAAHAASSVASAKPNQQVAGGGVTVTAILLKDQVGATAIKVEMDTHSVNLDGYKFEEIVLLRDDSGKIHSLEAVETPSGGGHHREAVLRFAKLPAEVKMIELVVKDVAGIKERTFHWKTAE